MKTIKPNVSGIRRGKWKTVSIIISIVLMALLISIPALAQTETPSQNINPSPAATSTPTVKPGPNSNLFSLTFADIVDSVLPAVVYVGSLTIDTITGQPALIASGSGAILRSDGYILTNKHVLEGARTAVVILENREIFDITGMWKDDVTDLAIIKIDSTGLPVIPFADSDNIRVGDWVIALGHPLGISPLNGGATVTSGIVSNLGQSFSIGTDNYYDVIQTDSAINPGNSGGPLVNMNGEFIGLNTAGSEQAQNINFAINVSTAEHVFKDLVQYGQPHHPYLGVNLNDYIPMTSTEPNSGAIITDIEKGSPVDLAELQVGDILINLDKYPIHSATDLVRELWGHYDVGQTVHITFWRDGKQQSLDVVLTDRTSGNTKI